MNQKKVMRAPIKSSARALDVLELFSKLRRPLRLEEIHHALDLPQSSAAVLMKTLLASGYINYTRSTRTYFPTVRVSVLGDWINDLMLGPGHLANVIVRLSEQSDETAAVSAQNDIYVQHLKIAKPSHPFTLSPPEGTMRFLTESAPGLVLLSQMRRTVVDKITTEIVQRGGQAVDRDALHLTMDRISKDQSFTLIGSPVAGYTVIGVPLPAAAHGIPLCLAVGGDSDRMRERYDIVFSALQQGRADYVSDL